jgi:hypothetical protein
MTGVGGHTVVDAGVALRQPQRPNRVLEPAGAGGERLSIARYRISDSAVRLDEIRAKDAP